MPNTLKLAFPRGRRPSNALRRIGTLWLLGLLIMAPAPSSPQAAPTGAFPERLIKIVVPFPAGGPTDVAARLIGQALSSRVGQRVVVENLAGAGGRIGAKAAAGANPDGYTLLLGGTNVNAIMGAIYRNLGFDPIDSFAPIAAIYVDLLALAVSRQVAADTVEELVAYAKKIPAS